MNKLNVFSFLLLASLVVGAVGDSAWDNSGITDTQVVNIGELWYPGILVESSFAHNPSNFITRNGFGTILRYSDKTSHVCPGYTGAFTQRSSLSVITDVGSRCKFTGAELGKNAIVTKRFRGWVENDLNYYRISEPNHFSWVSGVNTITVKSVAGGGSSATGEYKFLVFGDIKSADSDTHRWTLLKECSYNPASAPIQSAAVQTCTINLDGETSVSGLILARSEYSSNKRDPVIKEVSLFKQ